MSRETEDRLYQAIQHGKQRGPPVRWDRGQELGWSRAAATGSDMPWGGGTLLLFQSFHAFSARQLLSFCGNSEWWVSFSIS